MRRCGLAFVVKVRVWGGKCSEISATIKLLYNPRVNKVFTIIFTSRAMKNILTTQVKNLGYDR